MKNILIPLELTDSLLEQKIIETAISHAKQLNSKCWLIHVADPNPEFIGIDDGPKYIRDGLAKELREEHRKVQKISDLFDEHKIENEGLLIQGATLEMIQVEIKKLKIDFLILGNKKHSFLDVFFKGSLTDSLVNEANIPILLIPNNE